MKGLERSFNIPVIEACWMTEASHQMTCNPLPPGIRKPGSVGLPTGQNVAIMDDAGEVGEIVINGTNVTLGYQNNPEANASAFTYGWFRTGDLDTRDKDGYFFISSRINEVINRGGEKVCPREIDEVFLTHPDVLQDVTFSVEHPTLGEEVITAVILREGIETSPDELREFAFESIADFKVPSKLIVVDEIPKGPTGKLQRIGLEDKLAKMLAVEYLEPRNDIEIKLVELHTGILDVEQIGVLDNFFMMGGILYRRFF